MYVIQLHQLRHQLKLNYKLLQKEIAYSEISFNQQNINSLNFINQSFLSIIK